MVTTLSRFDASLICFLISSSPSSFFYLEDNSIPLLIHRSLGLVMIKTTVEETQQKCILERGFCFEVSLSNKPISIMSGLSQVAQV